MSLLPKLGALLRRCQAAQSRCEAELVQLARQDGALAAEQEALASQGQGLRQLLLAQRPAGAMSRGQLFALQRKQAVLRRQLQNLDLQSGQLEEQRQAWPGGARNNRLCAGNGCARKTNINAGPSCSAVRNACGVCGWTRPSRKRGRYGSDDAHSRAERGHPAGHRGRRGRRRRGLLPAKPKDSGETPPIRTATARTWPANASKTAPACRQEPCGNRRCRRSGMRRG
ncbi:hypothetical protein JOS77_09235 [Chromobacterium haemolyticum]|nr:hypothetical protein JOS77_09235 [Chromobacterium haemolyticum]